MLSVSLIFSSRPQVNYKNKILPIIKPTVLTANTQDKVSCAIHYDHR